MPKMFNVTGYCDPEIHYMVDLTSRLAEVKRMIDAEMYFTINRARQFGKTTMLTALADYLKEDYIVISMDFQMMSSLSFESEQSFVSAFSRELLDLADEFPEDVEKSLIAFEEATAPSISLQTLFRTLRTWCAKTEKRLS